MDHISQKSRSLSTLNFSLSTDDICPHMCLSDSQTHVVKMQRDIKIVLIPTAYSVLKCYTVEYYWQLQNDDLQGKHKHAVIKGQSVHLTILVTTFIFQKDVVARRLTVHRCLVTYDSKTVSIQVLYMTNKHGGLYKKTAVLLLCCPDLPTFLFTARCYSVFCDPNWNSIMPQQPQLSS